MQRAPCSRSCGSACGQPTYSSKSCTRSAIGRLRGSTRWSFRKPPSSPMAREDPPRPASPSACSGWPRRASAACLARCAAAGVLVLAGLARSDASPAWPSGRHVRRARGRSSAGPGAVGVAVLGDDRRLAGRDGLALGQLAQRALVVHRHDLDPRSCAASPSRRARARRRSTRCASRCSSTSARTSAKSSSRRVLEVDDLLVAALARTSPCSVEHERDAAAHARGEVAAGRAEDHDAAAGHVLAAVVADALDDGVRRRSCGRRSARPPGRGRTRGRRSRRRAACCR